jgi:short-subunit dehydrogenase
MSLSGKRILLTGASGGIGRHVALELARRGAHLALVGRDEARLEALAQTLRAQGATAVPLAFDLAAPTGHEALIARAASALGGLDVLVNNAGVQRFGALSEEDPQAIVNLVAINVTAPLLLTRAALKLFCAAGAGHVVNVGSTFGAIGYPYFAAYSASKFALRGLSEALRRELKELGVKVTHVSPRATATSMNSPAVRELMKKTGARVDAPETVARAVAAAISGGPAVRQLGWPERFFVRLNALLPGLVDRGLVQQARVAAACAERSRA